MALTKHGWHIPGSSWEKGESKALQFKDMCEDPNVCEGCQADIKKWELGPFRDENKDSLPPAASSEHGLNRRAAILRLAEIHINGDRADTYGPPEESFGRIADLWDAMGFQVIARDRESNTYESRPVNATDVALALTLLKVSRIVGQPDHEDSWVDAAGYIGLGAEIELNKKGEKR